MKPAQSIYPVMVIILVHQQKQPDEMPRSHSNGTEHVFSHALRGGDGDSRGISTIDQRGAPDVTRNVSLRNMRALEVAVHKTSIMYSDAVPLKEIGSKKSRERDDESESL